MSKYIIRKIAMASMLPFTMQPQTFKQRHTNKNTYCTGVLLQLKGNGQMNFQALRGKSTTFRRGPWNNRMPKSDLS